MSYKAIAILGDSITNGYWDQPFAGWAARMVQKLSADRPYEIGMANFAVDGDRICDIYHKFCAGVVAMQSLDVLVIAGTSNDLIRWHAPDAQLDISPVMREEYWGRLLLTAKKIVPAIFVVGIAPIDETRNPSTGVNEWAFWTFNQDIQDYNDQIATICARHDVPFFNPYPACIKAPWNDMLHDGGHPNAAGHAFLADLVYQQIRGRI